MPGTVNEINNLWQEKSQVLEETHCSETTNNISCAQRSVNLSTLTRDSSYIRKQLVETTTSQCVENKKLQDAEP